MAGNIDKFMFGLEKLFLRFDIAEMGFIEPLAELLQKDPDRAIDLIVDTYNKALDDAYTNADGENVRSFVESFAGGPHEQIPWALYNTVGAVYPFLKREQKDRALGKILDILDLINYAEVNGLNGVGHTTGIHEPLLLSDIAIARALYWPGLDNGCFIIKNYDNLFDLQKDHVDEDGFFRHKGVLLPDKRFVKVESDFLVAYSLLRSDFCDWGENYIKIANPDFLQRTLKAIVGLRFSHADEKKLKRRRKRLEQLLPESVHERIEPLRKEADWVDFNQFR